MMRRNPLLSMLLTIALAALVLVVAPSATGTDSSSATTTTTQTERHVRIKALRMYAIPFIGEFNRITVDVNPTLPATQSYRVVLKVRDHGEWVRCAVHRTHNSSYDWVGTIGSVPHEVTGFRPCLNKHADKYRVIVPAQHGFLRTVVVPEPFGPQP